jgi:hypothetical protein
MALRKLLPCCQWLLGTDMKSESAKEDTGQQQGGKDMQANMPLDSFSKHDERQGGQRRVINIKRRPFPLGGMTTTRAVGIAAGSQLEISPRPDPIQGGRDPVSDAMAYRPVEANVMMQPEADSLSVVLPE